MLAGHLALGLAATRVEPKVPLAAAVGASFALDLAWPVLLLSSAESVRVHPHDTAFTSLAFDSIPGTILVEGGLFVAAIALYTRAWPARDATGRWAFAGLVALIGGLWITQPWSPPPNASAVAWGALSMWLLLPWCAWIARHRTRAVTA